MVELQLDSPRVDEAFRPRKSSFLRFLTTVKIVSLVLSVPGVALWMWSLFGVASAIASLLLGQLAVLLVFRALGLLPAPEPRQG